MSTLLERKIGLILTIIAIAWASYYLAHYRLLTADVRLGPLQVFMLGLMTWLHGRFRQSLENHHS